MMISLETNEMRYWKKRVHQHNSVDIVDDYPRHQHNSVDIVDDYPRHQHNSVDIVDDYPRHQHNLVDIVDDYPRHQHNLVDFTIFLQKDKKKTLPWLYSPSSARNHCIFLVF